MKQMDMRYLANNWVLHKLSTENKNNRVRICGELLAMHRNNDFLNQLVTGDELWLYWDNEGVGSRRRSWVAPGGDALAVPKRTLTLTNCHRWPNGGPPVVVGWPNGGVGSVCYGWPTVAKRWQE